jgi:uncharacterized membrane protein YphA (DoxX/SURF4 family)
MDAIKPPVTWKTVALWTLSVLLAAFFLMAGGAKLTGNPSQAAAFARWGYPGWFLYVVGVVEAAGGLALLIPRLAGFAALTLGATMVGAALTHLFHGETTAAPVPGVLLLLVSLVGYARREYVRKLLGDRRRTMVSS